jgi:hypothetical protein
MAKVALNVRVDPAIRDAIVKLAKVHNRSVSNLVETELLRAIKSVSPDIQNDLHIVTVDDDYNEDAVTTFQTTILHSK